MSAVLGKQRPPWPWDRSVYWCLNSVRVNKWVESTYFYPTFPTVLSTLRDWVTLVGQMAKCPGSDGGYETFFTTTGYFLGHLMSKEKNWWKVRVYLMSHLALLVSGLASERRGNDTLSFFWENDIVKFVICGAWRTACQNASLFSLGARIRRKDSSSMIRLFITNFRTLSFPVLFFFY